MKKVWPCIIFGIIELIFISLYVMDIWELNIFMITSSINLFVNISYFFFISTLDYLLYLYQLYAHKSKFKKKAEQMIASQRKVNDNPQFYLFHLKIERFQSNQKIITYKMTAKILKTIIFRLKQTLWNQSLISSQSEDLIFLFIPKTKKYNQLQYEEIAEEIMKIFHEPFYLKGFEIHITCRIGISIFPDHSENIEGLISRADIASHPFQENSYKHYSMYNLREQNITINKMSLERELRKAVENHEFEIYYQPQIETETNKICGAEALLRWRHPEIGSISPSVFIPIAEETGIINKLGEWVLKNTIVQFKRWEEEGLELDYISINISLVEFMNENLVETVKKTLSMNSVESSKLMLELTERIAIPQLEDILIKLNEFKEIGVKLALDDFGTGYSSLHYLSHLPVDCLKIDQSFIRPIKNSNEKAVILKSIIHMAKELNLKVIAEGVETKTQSKFVKKIGCDQYQGYYYSPPVTSLEFKKLYEMNRRSQPNTLKKEDLLLV